MPLGWIGLTADTTAGGWSYAVATSPEESADEDDDLTERRAPRPSDDDDEDNTLSLAQMEETLKPQALEKFANITAIYKKFGKMQESRLEAMAAGTPVVASDLEAFVRVLDYGAAGRTFHNGDSAALAEVVNRLLSDPTERERLSRAGRARAQTFDWSHIAADIVDVYEAVATPGHPVAPDLIGQLLGRWAT